MDIDIRVFNSIIKILFMVIFAYQIFYVIVAFVKRQPKYTNPIVYHRFAVLICARNEESVLGNLIESIKTGDYPQNLVDVYVMADNCTDSTARVAENRGAIVYTRENKTLVGKGYALEALLNKIAGDAGVDKYDGYFVFDADNLIRHDYITRMNEKFCQGYDVITSLRNSKNYGDNWLTAGCGLRFLRECKFLNLPRDILGTPCPVGGTGFLFSRKALMNRDGWHYHLLTEDIQFSVDNIIKDAKMGYCDKAMFYDEQPDDLSQSVKQRMRWRKGIFQVVASYGNKLIEGMFSGKFACYDMLACFAAPAFLSFLCFGANVFTLSVYAANGLSEMFIAKCIFDLIAGSYSTLFFIGSLTTISCWKILRCPNYKKVLYTFTFPFFMMTYLPISVMALFTNVRWTPIKHKDAKKIKEI